MRSSLSNYFCEFTEDHHTIIQLAFPSNTTSNSYSDSNNNNINTNSSNSSSVDYRGFPLLMILYRGKNDIVRVQWTMIDYKLGKILQG